MKRTSLNSIRVAFFAATIGSISILPLNAAAPAAPVVKSAPKTAEQLYQEGRTAFYSNDFVTAKDRFVRVLRLAPTHMPSKALLAQVQKAETEAMVKAASLETRMKTLTVSQFALDKATVSEALDFVRLKAQQLSQNGVPPNFVIKLDETTSKKPISFSLGQTSLYEVLRAIADTGGLEVHYSQYMATISPKGVATTSGSSGEALLKK